MAEEQTVVEDAIAEDHVVASASGATRPARIGWLDAARGMGIILVVYGHALRGWVSAGIVKATPIEQLQDRLIYSFHMPLFFLLSGLVVGRSLARGKGEFLRTRWLTIVWPYLLWSVLQGSISMAAGDAANHPVTPGTLVAILWDPFAQFWFLYALLLCQLTLLLPGRWTLPVLVGAGVVLESVTNVGGILAASLKHLPYFALGYWVTAGRLDAQLSAPAKAAIVAAVAWAMFAIFTLIDNPAAPPVLALQLAQGFAGSIGVIAVARLVMALPGLQALGAASMAIFLMHVMAAAVFRIVAKKLHVHGELSLLLGVVVGIAAPYIFLRITQRLGIAWWFGFESRKRRGGGRKPLNLSSGGAI
ncbi:acyltransferase [Sphingomonas sp.]|uniref:acyltransferase family protein n=1 Tax=Sphingomonas sp. TaxID=28214 RepID=UPI001B1BC53C|nr:acyltransferase [Sphingomonas sp.]MBO9712564.1 acyltransferase [Sphingomonas sp.]